MAADNSLTKKAHLKQQWTEQQINDMMACMDPENGHIHFAKNFFYIQHPTKGKVLFDPYAYQLKLLYSYHTYRFNVNMLPRQSGKALCLTTPIPTPTGWTTMGDVSVGDTILSPSGLATTVIFATDVMFGRVCYEIVFDNGDKIIADAEHLWKINFSNNENQLIMTTDDILTCLNENPVVSAYILSISPIQSNNILVDISPYELGNVLREKYLSNKTNSNSVYTHIPTNYLRAPIQQRKELLTALFNGILEQDTDFEISTQNFEFVNSVRELLSSFGIKTFFSSLIDNGAAVYVLRISLKRILNFLRDGVISTMDNADERIYITSIKQVPSVPVKCIQVDSEDHMFLCGKSMIQTHNTTCASAYLLWYAMFHPDQTILVAAHKFTGAQEIMQRIRYGYELCPDYLRAGVISYNKGSIEFDNGSRIISQTTTGTTGRGLSISLMYCLDGGSCVKIRDKKTLLEEDITLSDLFSRLYKPLRIITDE